MGPRDSGVLDPGSGGVSTQVLFTWVLSSWVLNLPPLGLFVSRGTSSTEDLDLGVVASLYRAESFRWLLEDE